MTQSNFILDLLRKLFQAVKAFRMYGGDHPQTEEYLRTLEGAIGSFPAGEGTITIVFHGNTLLVQEVVQPSRDQAVSYLTESLSARAITSLSFHPGVSYGEVLQVVRILAAKPEDVLDGKNLKESLQQGFRNVSFNKIRYVAVDESEKVVAASEAPAMVHQQRSLSRSIEGLAEALERAGFSGVDELPEGALETKGSLGDERRPDGSPVPRSTQELLDYIAQRVVPGMTSAWDQLTRILGQMSKSVRFRLGDAGKTAIPAAIVAHQLESGIAPEVVQKTFRELAPERKDALMLFDALTKAMQDSGKVFSGESLQKLIGFLPQLAEEQAVQGRVLVVEGDAARSAALQGALAELAYQVDTASTAKEAIEKVNSIKELDAIVLQLDLPDKRGTVVLSRLQASHRMIPAVIVGEKVSADSCDFEVFSYPNKKILHSDDPKVAAEAVGEFVKKGPPRSDASRKADLDHAREIQRKLVPEEMPPLQGWELDLLHEPAQEVGGDLIDVFKIGDERIGLLIGEVSERGTATARVMVMLRSTFRLSATDELSPTELVIRVNRLLAPDMRRGMYVTLISVSVHLPSGRVSLINCGHASPILYDARDHSVGTIPTQGLPIGLGTIEKFQSTLRQVDLTLAPGGQLLFHTNGVSETLNERQEPFQEERLLEVVKREGSWSSLELLRALQAEIAAHRGSAAPSRSTDVTLLALRRTPPDPSGHPLVT